VNQDILKELRKPFHPSQVTWKPGSLNQERTRALALAYGDLRAYQNRLDEVCGMDWSVNYTPWGDRIVCHLTVHGVTRSSTGESDAQSERSEIAGTAAEAQAFKRACAMFGLGRYLYNLPSLWVEYDPQSRSFTDKARARLDMIVNQHYNRAMSGETEAGRQEPADGSTTLTTGTTQASQEVTETSSGSKTIKTLAAPRTGAHAQPTLKEQFEALGKELYDKAWERTRKYNVEKISNGQSSVASELAPEQLQKLVDGMKSLKEKREKEKVAA
jgi:hypothetical protein